MITIRKKQYHVYPTTKPNGCDEEKCHGCSFEKAKPLFCQEIMDEIDHEPCGDGDIVFVMDNPKHIARYMAARMGGADEPIHKTS